MKTIDLSLQLNNPHGPNGKTARGRFRWRNASHLVLASALCVVLSHTAVAQISGGNPAVAAGFVDTYFNSNEMDRNVPINGTGVLTSWSFYAGALQPVELVIYRGAGTGPYTEIGTFGPVTPTTLGLNTFTITPPIPVLAGDLMGFYYPNTGSVEYNYNPPSSAVNTSFGFVSPTATMFITADNSGNSANFDDSSDRTYSSNVSGVVPVAPTLSKTFGATYIFTGTTTTLTFTLANPNTFVLAGTSFSDTLPVGLLVASPNGLTGSCGGGTITAVAGTNSISLTGASLAASSSCTFSVNVAGVSPGTQLNTTSTVTSTLAPAGAAATASILVFLAADTDFQVSYAADPAAGESYINIINTGAQGAPLLGPGFGTQTGNICVQVYAFAPDEQEISCCTCTITPNSVANLGVNRDLTSNTLTNVIPTSVVVKLVAINPTSTASGSCTAAQEGTPVAGMVAYGTTPQPLGTVFNVVEHSFRPSTLSTGPTTGNNEYASITGRCASILGNGSSFGVCNSCKSGALGAEKQ